MTGERDERPWGRYEVLDDGGTHKVKRIEGDPGRRLSYQRHGRRAEHWIVVTGTAEVTLDGRTHRLESGRSIDIPVRVGASCRQSWRRPARLHRGAARGLLRRRRHRTAGGRLRPSWLRPSGSG